MIDPYLGDIQMFPYNFVPRGWTACDGQLLPISGNDTLFTLLGTMYGGDGRTTFALPDLRGRVPIHEGNGAGLTPRRLGDRGGSEEVALTHAQMPPHTHSLEGIQADANSSDPNDFLAGDSTHKHYYDRAGQDPNKKKKPQEVHMHPSTIGLDGGGQPHDNMQPFLAMTFCIATIGVYPS